jgi:hypothetical protein
MRRRAMGKEVWVMRVLGVGLLVFGFVLGGDAAVDARHYRSNPQPRPCELNGISYPVSSYCYTSCAPNAACEVLACFTGGAAGGEWVNIGACKARDCRRVC